jgi:hypothetical protein
MNILKWRRFISLLLVTLMLAIATPAFGFGNGYISQVPNPRQSPVVVPPANDNNSIPPASNDNKSSVGMVIRTGLGLILRIPIPYKDAILAGSAAVTVELAKQTGETKITWSDVFEAVKRGEYSLETFSSNAPIVAPPRVYPCGDAYITAGGKIPSEAPNTPDENALFELANPKTSDVAVAGNMVYQIGNLPNAARLVKEYGNQAKNWAEYRTPLAKSFVSEGRKVYLRWFGTIYSVERYEYQFVSECKAKGTPDGQECVSYRSAKKELLQDLQKIEQQFNVEHNPSQRSSEQLIAARKNAINARRQADGKFIEAIGRKSQEIANRITARNMADYGDRLGANYEWFVKNKKDWLYGFSLGKHSASLLDRNNTAQGHDQFFAELEYNLCEGANDKKPNDHQGIKKDPEEGPKVSGAEKIERKSPGFRRRWAVLDKKGKAQTIYEWDSQHGEWEVYNNRGIHQGTLNTEGVFNPNTKVPGRVITP